MDPHLILLSNQPILDYNYDENDDENIFDSGELKGNWIDFKLGVAGN